MTSGSKVMTERINFPCFVDVKNFVLLWQQNMTGNLLFFKVNFMHHMAKLQHAKL